MRSAAALLLLFAGCAPSRPPNLLLVTLDTTRFDVIGAFGAPGNVTPHIDELAARSTRFSRAYSVTPLTIPAHSSIHTGIYPPRHGVRDNGDFFLGDDAVTVAERLHDAGYTTMASVGAEVTSHHWGFSQGFDDYFDDMGPVETGGNRWRVERRGEAVVDDALKWLDANDGKEKPWFAWVHMFDAHHPYEPPEPYATMFDGKPYQGEVAYADAQLGRILKWLDEKGRRENTWVIVVADHGESLGAHGEGMHGVLLYDVTTHIPMIVSPPTKSTTAEVATPVSLVDITPTLLGAAGVPMPAGLDGVDLGPLTRGTPSDPNRQVYAESEYAFHHYGWAPQRALVTDQKKLIDSTTPELYAREDVAERKDLAPGDAATVNELEGHLDTLAAAMTPMGGASRATLSAERIQQLEALGYMTGEAPTTATEGLPDPVKQMPVLKQLEVARQAMVKDDVAAARAALEKALEVDPRLVESRMLLASVALREGKLDEAAGIVQAVEAERPGSQPKMMLGAIEMQRGNPAEAARLYGAALELDPYQAQAWGGYLHALVLSGDPRIGLEADRAAKLLPDSPMVHGMQGVALAMAGRVALAEPLLRDALDREPNQPFINHALAMCLKQKGDTMGAEPFLEEEIRLFPPALPSRRALVEIYAAQKRYDEQLAQLEVIRAREAPSADTLHSIAQAQFNLHRYPESQVTVEECRALAPEYPGCALLEANVLKKLGKDAEAQAAYDRAVKLANPKR